MPAAKDDKNTRVAGARRTASGAVKLSADEALLRLQLLSDISKALETVGANFDELAKKACDALVPAFADLCVIELLTDRGQLEITACRSHAASGLRTGPLAPFKARCKAPVLAYQGNEQPGPVADARRGLQAESLIIAPIGNRGTMTGHLVLATGPLRRAFRPSALRIGVEVAARLSSALERKVLQQQVEAVSKQQSRVARRLLSQRPRRPATSAHRGVRLVRRPHLKRIVPLRRSPGVKRVMAPR